jgi:2-polyprenyl-3-methyl-5-hydroxy-6-metoxy-1,4-benzoquinol methylase
MRLPAELRCPEHGLALTELASPAASETRLATLQATSIPAADVRFAGERAAAPPEAWLGCSRQCRFPIVRGIPRFVRSDGYAEGFGLQWLAFRRTQLDSHTGTSISRERLARCLGGTLSVVEGRSVLEVGCGAGRFTELLLAAGARVFAVDLSAAVEANRENCGAHPAHFVCQADLAALPAAREAFDVVLALGMLQHTPSPEESLRVLAAYLRPGGLLVVDHYARPRSLPVWLGAFLHPRAILRAGLVRLPATTAFRATQGLAALLLPLHRALWRPGPGYRWARKALHLVSPLFDYYDKFPCLSREHLEAWARLDTQDGLSDRYKHLRSVREVRAALEEAGLAEVGAAHGGNGVEARGTKPATPRS